MSEIPTKRDVTAMAECLTCDDASPGNWSPLVYCLKHQRWECEHTRDPKHEWTVDLESISVQADTEEEATEQAREILRSGAGIDEVIHNIRCRTCEGEAK